MLHRGLLRSQGFRSQNRHADQRRTRALSRHRNRGIQTRRIHRHPSSCGRGGRGLHPCRAGPEHRRNVGMAALQPARSRDGRKHWQENQSHRHPRNFPFHQSKRRRRTKQVSRENGFKDAQARRAVHHRKQGSAASALRTQAARPHRHRTAHRSAPACGRHPQRRGTLPCTKTPAARRVGRCARRPALAPAARRRNPRARLRPQIHRPLACAPTRTPPPGQGMADPLQAASQSLRTAALTRPALRRAHHATRLPPRPGMVAGNPHARDRLHTALDAPARPSLARTARPAREDPPCRRHAHTPRHPRQPHARAVPKFRRRIHGINRGKTR